MKYDIVSLGQAVIDFSGCGLGPAGNPAFEMNPGGSGCAVVLPAAQLGGRAACLGTVGDDMFGRYALKRLDELNVDTGGTKICTDQATRLVFVSLDSNGDRSFSFVKGTGTKSFYTEELIDFSYIKNSKLFYAEYCYDYDSDGMRTVEKAAKFAKENGVLFAMDINYRPGAICIDAAGIRRLFALVEQADYLKLTEQEMEMLTGIPRQEHERGAKQLLATGKQAIFVTLGPEGCYFAAPDDYGYIPPFEVKAVDTTGCGDAFFGTVLYYVTRGEGVRMRDIVIRANAYGALCSSKRGTFDAMPTKEELAAFLQGQNITL